MSEEQINTAIAEAIDADPHWKCAKDYCNDLNAMREAEETLAESLQEKYLDNLYSVCNPDTMYNDTWKMNRATATERAEAFLKTIGKWKE
jgi:hypothetical protein